MSSTAKTIGRTALLLASQYKGFALVAQALVEASADVSAAISGDVSQLVMHASQNGPHADVVQALVEGVAKVNATKSGGGTALIVASKRGHLGVVRALLAAGADVGVALPDGRTALTAACERRRYSVAAVLVRHGAAVTRDTIARCYSLEMAKSLVMRGGARVTEALAAAAPTEKVQSFLEVWLTGTHPAVQVARREAEESLLAARWPGASGGEYFPAELVSIVGEYVHARERRVRRRGRGSSTSSSSSS